MSLLSLFFASVCLMLEPIHSICVRLHCVAGAQCQTRPILSRAGGSHCVFVVCPAGSVPQHAATSFVLVSVSLSRADVRRLGVGAFANAHLSLVTDFPCLCGSALPSPPPVPSLFLPSSCRRKPDLGHWGQRTGCGPQWVSTEVTSIE